MKAKEDKKEIKGKETIKKLSPNPFTMLGNLFKEKHRKL